MKQLGKVTVLVGLLLVIAGFALILIATWQLFKFDETCDDTDVSIGGLYRTQFAASLYLRIGLGFFWGGWAMMIAGTTMCWLQHTFGWLAQPRRLPGREDQP